MFKRCAILALVILLGIPSLAVADMNGFYVAPKFLMSIQNTGQINRSEALAGTGVNDYSQFTLGGALALGVDFWHNYSVPARLEGEFSLRGNSEKSWSGNGAYQVKGVWNNSTFFGNLYWDFRNDSQIVPYLGGGIGIALNYTGYDFKGPGENFSKDARFTNFAWNLGGGVGWNLTESLTADLAYRFMSLGYNEVKATDGNKDLKIGNAPYNNEFTLGLRFTF
ncbi:MAG: outer membrane beta-barrel protein [Desulfovibrio sp.]|jgi:opacity protein-like surface antigen|nr:outer membrane beta-barrel protein [Desulfovibrio sp.]